MGRARMLSCSPRMALPWQATRTTLCRSSSRRATTSQPRRVPSSPRGISAPRFHSRHARFALIPSFSSRCASSPRRQRSCSAMRMPSAASPSPCATSANGGCYSARLLRPFSRKLSRLRAPTTIARCFQSGRGRGQRIPQRRDRGGSQVGLASVDVVRRCCVGWARSCCFVKYSTTSTRHSPPSSLDTGAEQGQCVTPWLPRGCVDESREAEVLLKYWHR
mmetsp:Transcript_43290/g.113754  ORF Transcript_43290/g.113754 Transcript_43290/m.113754 type:complete len:220 (+) Transcript_43290:1668-2327(+)